MPREVSPVASCDTSHLQVLAGLLLGRRLANLPHQRALEHYHLAHDPARAGGGLSLSASSCPCTLSGKMGFVMDG